MTIYTNFSDALSIFRQDGGAMNYHQTSSNEQAAWEVDDAGELAERITCSPREATARALAAGGFKKGEIDAELADWTD